MQQLSVQCYFTRVRVTTNPWFLFIVNMCHFIAVTYDKKSEAPFQRALNWKILDMSVK